MDDYLFFVEAGPRDGWVKFVDYAASISENGMGEARLVAPFIPMIPGTDIYTDQLW